jgi:hypothetical protein
VRLDDAESSVPQYSEGQAGPSAIPAYGAPPPFEERDAPPPFFAPGEGSTAAGLPSFLESEREIIVAHDQAQSDIQHVPSSPLIHGEGIEFGFPSSSEFDGHSLDVSGADRSSTPPPSLEMASQDTDITGLTELQGTEEAIQALGLVLEQQEQQNQGSGPPPPPPPMDDPMDPPPAIDFDFRAGSESGHDTPTGPPPPHESYVPVPESPPPLHEAYVDDPPPPPPPMSNEHPNEQSAIEPPSPPSSSRVVP